MNLFKIYKILKSIKEKNKKYCKDLKTTTNWLYLQKLEKMKYLENGNLTQKGERFLIKFENIYLEFWELEE